MKKKKILVTGATGTLGSILVSRFQDNECDCVGIARNDSVNDLTCKILKCDVTKINDVMQVIEKFQPDIIIHLASITGNVECEMNPHEAFVTNVLGTYNILRASIKIKPKIIFASTREVYGNTEKKAKENDHLKPINVNGITKLLSEYLILNFYKRYAFPYQILRFTNFYGENYYKRGISAMIRNALQGKTICIFGGEQEIDLLHFDDAASAVLLAVRNNQSGIFNIGSGKSVTPLILINKLEEICKRKIALDIKPYRDFEVRKFSLNITKSVEVLKFHVIRDLDTVLEKMVRRWHPK